MLAPASLPWKYRWFNLKWGAPSGCLVRGLLSRERRATPWGAPLVGPFAFQGNNTTRAFEYHGPWKRCSFGPVSACSRSAAVFPVFNSSSISQDAR